MAACGGITEDNRMNDTKNTSAKQDQKTISKEENAIAAASEKRAQELESQYEEDKRQEDQLLPDGFYFDGGLLMYQPEGIANQESPAPVYICSRLEIIACIRDDDNQNHGQLLRFWDVDGYEHEWAMPMGMLAGDGAQYREVLLGMGLRIAPGNRARQLLANYIQSAKPLARARCVSCTGWYKECFVLPDQVIGDLGSERVVLQAVSNQLGDFGVSGTVQDWREAVSLLCIGNNRLIFSVSVAFASSLLKLLGIENGGFHFRGGSSTGKTTALYVAASVWGSKDYVQRWRATVNGIEAMAAGHNDALLGLDELAQVTPEAAGEIAYMLANGVGKVRCDRQGYGRKRAQWRLIFLSTGELSLAAHIMEANKRIRAGQEVRIVDIPADLYQYGLFENLHGYSDGDAFSQVLVQKSSEFHGAAARFFLEQLVKNQEEAVALVRSFIEKFIAALVPKNADGQVYRAARRFALVAAAGELATVFQITGWPEGTAMCAAETCFTDWLKNRGGVGSQEEQAILSQARHFFEKNGEIRFTPWDTPKDYRTANRAGFWKEGDAGEKEFFVLPETFRTEVAQGLDYKLFAKICLRNGYLKPGSKGELTRSERLPFMTRNTRCYRFTSRVLGDEAAGVGEN